MNKILITIFLVSLTHCSFDNKTGIWKNDSEIGTKKISRFEDFETLYTQEKTFEEIILPSRKLKASLEVAQTSIQWADEFYNSSNKFNNFTYKNVNELVFKSKKLTKNKPNERFLFDGANIILADNIGNITVYSVEYQNIVFKYNFYQKKYKKINKVINYIIENNIIYVADNIGYLYALNYKTKKLIWAKNYKIPFRSNLKISNEKIFVSDQNNGLYIINKYNGERIRLIPTEENTLKNNFINNFALDNKNLFYLNTYGSLYSVSNTNSKINWFINLNKSIDLNMSSLFYSNPIQIHNNTIVISTDPYLYLIDSNTGTTIFKKAITSVTKPIISGNNLFLITKDNLLVSIDLNSGKILYSLSISQEIGNFLDSKNKEINIRFLSMLDDNLFIFLNNSYVVQFNSLGSIEQINKLPAKLGSLPIFINNSILYLNKKNKLIILN